MLITLDTELLTYKGWKKRDPVLQGVDAFIEGSGRLTKTIGEFEIFGFRLDFA